MKTTFAAAFAFAAVAASFVAAAPIQTQEVLLAERELPTQAGFTNELIARSVGSSDSEVLEPRLIKMLGHLIHRHHGQQQRRSLSDEDDEAMIARSIASSDNEVLEPRLIKMLGHLIHRHHGQQQRRSLSDEDDEELIARSIASSDNEVLEPRLIKMLGHLMHRHRGQQERRSLADDEDDSEVFARNVLENAVISARSIDELEPRLVHRLMGLFHRHSTQQRRSLSQDDDDFELQARGVLDEEDLKALQTRLINLVKGLIKRLRKSVAKKISEEFNNDKKPQGQQPVQARGFDDEDFEVLQARNSLIEDLSDKDLKALQSRLIKFIKKFIGELRKDKADGKVWGKPNAQNNNNNKDQSKPNAEAHKRSFYNDEGDNWEARDLDAMLEGRDDYVL